jgi:micrococcal nuclease
MKTVKLLHTIVILSAALAARPALAANTGPHRDIVQGPVRGEVTDVVDGDTIEVRLHVWIGEDVTTRVRVSGIDAPELHGKCGGEREKAAAAKREMEHLVASGAVTLTGIRLEKYAGRVLTQVETPDGTDVGQHMLQGGFARAYHGERRGSWCDGLF